MAFRYARCAVLLVLAAGPLLTACTDTLTECQTCPTPTPTPTPTPAPARTLQSVTVAGPQTAAVGEPVTLSVRASYSDGTTGIVTSGITWSTSDAQVLAISASGIGSPNAPGKSVVTASYGTKTATMPITVTASPIQPIFPQPLDHLDYGETQVQIRGVWSHACPPNHAMGGVVFGGNTFACRYVGTIVAETIESVVRAGMLACPPDYFMTALNVERNYLRCSRNGNPVSAAEVTSANARTSPVSECNGSNSIQAAVMVGFHHERSQMLCAAVQR